jgi:hypothetical protein
VATPTNQSNQSKRQTEKSPADAARILTCDIFNDKKKSAGHWRLLSVVLGGSGLIFKFLKCFVIIFRHLLLTMHLTFLRFLSLVMFNTTFECLAVLFL